jgi:GDP-mannose 6-dehydrogenase
MNVSVFGLGYVGCVTAACLARDGHHVIGVDVNAEKVAMINGGTSPIIEPGLSELVAHVVRQGRLSATDSAREGIAGADVALICVGTPDLGHGQPDYDGLARVASAIGSACETRVQPLTVSAQHGAAGTTERVLARVLSECPDVGRMNEPLRIAVNPEFMREGSSIEDFDRPPFVLVGCDDPAAETLLRQLYSSVDAPFLQTSVRTAEMVKYVCNAFHALKITFTNEIADLCDALGADAQDVMRVFRHDRKLNIAPAYLRPGFAFGGSCLPKDVRALLCSGRIYDVSTPVLSAMIQSNKAQIQRGVEAVLQTRKKKVGVVGLAFKSNTDDLRESPMVTLVETLIGKGCDVKIYDPNVVMARLKGANRTYIEQEIPHVSSLLCDSPECLIDHADVLVFGNAGQDSASVLAAARPDQAIVDLTRGAVFEMARAPQRAERAWSHDARSGGGHECALLVFRCNRTRVLPPCNPTHLSHPSCSSQRRRHRAEVERPDDPVAAGQSLQNAIEQAASGDLHHARPGRHLRGSISAAEEGRRPWLDSDRLERSRRAAGRQARERWRRAPYGEAGDRRGSAVISEPGAHHYRFAGVEIAPAPGEFIYNLIQLGEGESEL